VSRKNTYLILAFAGALVPYFFFFRHIANAGFGLTEFVVAVFANPAAAGFTADLLISSFVFWVAMFHRRSLGKGPNPLLFIILNMLIGLSCALPAYLYASEGSVTSP
jgi:hypothetical protein